MDERQRRIARARLLRRQGKTYDEIRAVIGAVDNGTLRQWLRGVPRPAATYRSRPLTELRRECRRLRAQGMSYDEISALTGVSAGSLSLWLSDVGVTPARRRRLSARPPRGTMPYAVAMRQSAAAVRARRRTEAGFALGSTNSRELLAAGVALYLAEGSKAKPWRPRDRQVVLTNSDPDVIALFLAWLDLIGVPEGRRSYRLSIHESADVAAHERWWQTTLSLPTSSFRKPTLKRHVPVTVRKNVNETYHGCLVVRVLKPAPVYDAIEGWWKRLVVASDLMRAESVGWTGNDPGSSKGRTASFGVAYGGSNPSPGACAPDPIGSDLVRIDEEPA